MIPRYNGAQAQKMTSGSALPAGGYVAIIQSAKVESYSWGSVLVLAIDIAEGEYTGHFRKMFDGSSDPDRKWKGTFRVTIPNEKSQYVASEKRTFNNLIYALENSNPSYTFDWNEKSLKGKFIGVLYRNKEFEASDGKIIKTTECGGCTDIQAIRDNDFTPLKDKLLNREETAPAPSSTSTNDFVDDDLPFN